MGTLSLLLLIPCSAGLLANLAYRYRYRQLVSAPKESVRSAGDAYVRLVGQAKIVPGKSMISPFSKMSCCWYSYSIEEPRRSSKTTSMVVIESGISDGLFLLEDETGACLVDPTDAHIVTLHQQIWSGDSLDTHIPVKHSPFINGQTEDDMTDSDAIVGGYNFYFRRTLSFY